MQIYLLLFMKIQLEAVASDPNSSFRIMVNPRLSDFYFWHFHEAIELVYIEGTNGNRHVGNHLSKFSGSDLVLIGSNIPHLNFDFGVKSSYEKRVIHIQPAFLSSEINLAIELLPLKQLFENAKNGIVFGQKTKIILATRIKKINELPPFERYLELIAVLNILANAPDFELLHSEPFIAKAHYREHQRMKLLYQFLDDNFLRKIEIEEVASLCSLSKAAFCRFFKQMTKLTFIEFLNHYRINHSKNILLSGKNVTETCFASGFESLSYFNRTFKKITDKSPLEFKKNYEV
jgi:AraC-like DNA-binding protein